MFIIQATMSGEGYVLTSLIRPVRTTGPNSLGRGTVQTADGYMSRLWVHAHSSSPVRHWRIIPDNWRTS